MSIIGISTKYSFLDVITYNPPDLYQYSISIHIYS